MDNPMIMGILNNAILLLGLGIIYSLIPVEDLEKKLLHKLIVGVLLSIIVVFVILTPFEITTGVVLDTRSIQISVATLFFGPIPGILMVISASALRISQGGDGVLTGVLVITSSWIIGYLFRRFRLKRLLIEKNIV